MYSKLFCYWLCLKNKVSRAVKPRKVIFWAQSDLYTREFEATLLKNWKKYICFPLKSENLIQSHYTIEYTSNQKEASQECNTCLYLICMLWQSEPPLKRMLRCLQWSLWHFPSILINTLIHIFSNVKNVRIYGQQIFLPSLNSHPAYVKPAAWSHF